ncbi:MAG: tetratricopeptide repeat-containing sensor histidine kinase [Maribacter sp.]
MLNSLPKQIRNFNISQRNYFVLVVLLFVLGPVFSQISSRDDLRKEIELQRERIGFIKKDTLYVNRLIELAKQQRFYKLDSLYSLSKETLSISEKMGYLKGQVNSLLNLGDYFSDKGEIDEALLQFNKAHEIALENQFQVLVIECLDALSTEYAYQGNYSQALKGYLSALEIAEEIDEKKFLSITNENVANLYLSQKDYDQAMVFFKKVKAINEEIGDPTVMAETMSNMASAYADMNQLEYAMFHINSSITTFEKEKILEWLAYAYEIKGKIYLKSKKYNWALYWFKQSELIHEKVDDDRGEIALLNGMAETYLHICNDTESEFYAKQAFILSNDISYNIGRQESSKLLFQINKKKQDFENALKFHEIYQSTSDSLSKKENKKALNMLKTTMEYEQQKNQLMLNNEKALAKQKIYIYVSVIILVIFLVMLLLIRRNESIQKRLNKELLSNKLDLEQKEEYLKELNQTKNKLFSIIGHDLRGPIGAFQGLLKLFKQGEMTNEEFLSFIPKLKVDIDNISFTLNNLLSWGQTQLNGSITKLGETDLKVLVDENIGLLSEIANSKSITIKNTVLENTKIWSDMNQIDIVVRNLLSNALKFTHNGGLVVIGAIEKTRNWEIYIQDDGLGMSEETMSRIFKKDANHSTYGTNDEKGTGLGLSLCKEMVEKNNGKMWVNSALGKGSSFYFTIPKMVENYKRSA